MIIEKSEDSIDYNYTLTIGKVVISHYGVKDEDCVFSFRNVLDMQIIRNSLHVTLKTNPTSDHSHYQFPMKGAGKDIFEIYFQNLGRI